MSSFGAAAISDEPTSDAETALGSGAIYQYCQTPWETIRESLAVVADAGYDAIQVPPAGWSKRTWSTPEPQGPSRSIIWISQAVKENAPGLKPTPSETIN